MSRAVLISIQPKWCELIASGKKTVEVRKTKPKIETPFKVYIYCTKAKDFFTHGRIRETLDDLYRLPSGEIKFGYSGELMCYGVDEYTEDNFLNGKVIGEFVCDGYDEFTPTKTGISIKRFSALYETCLSVEEMRAYLGEKIGYGWHISNLKIYDKPKDLSKFFSVDSDAVKNCEHRERIYNNPDFTNGAMLPGSYLCNDKTNWCTKCKIKPISRPPQSWCYVEEMRADG